MTKYPELKAALECEIDRQFGLFSSYIEKKRACRLDFSWCLNSRFYTPSVLELRRLGKTKKESFFNYVLFYFSKKIWSAWIWKAISKTVLEKIQARYFPHSDPLGHFFIHHMAYSFLKYVRSFQEASLIEMLNLCSRCVSAAYYLRYRTLDIYADEKRKQNAACKRIYQSIRSTVLKRPDAFLMTFYLSIKANDIDSFESDSLRFIQGFSEEIDTYLDQEHVQIGRAHV